MRGVSNRYFIGGVYKYNFNQYEDELFKAFSLCNDSQNDMGLYRDDLNLYRKKKRVLKKYRKYLNNEYTTETMIQKYNDEVENNYNNKFILLKRERFFPYKYQRRNYFIEDDKFKKTITKLNIFFQNIRKQKYRKIIDKLDIPRHVKNIIFSYI